MRALLHGTSGLVLDQQHPVPQPIEGEALVRVLLAGICNTDLEIVRGYMDFHGVPGHEFVGVVEEIYGSAAQTSYAHLLGKRVVGDINAACRQPDCYYCQRGIFSQCPRRTTLGIVARDGAFAEYLSLPVENLHVVPDSVSNEEAVFVEPLAANFQILEQIHVKPTDKLIILGDGKMGLLAAQVLTLTGCEVIMLGRHTEKLALAAQRGVRTYLIETTQQVPVDLAHSADIVVECTGSSQGLEMALQLLKARGVLALKSTVAEKSLIHLAPIVIDEIRVQGSRCGPFEPALRALAQNLIDVRPLVSACYTLEEGLIAFEKAAQKGVLKVLLRPEY